MALCYFPIEFSATLLGLVSYRQDTVLTIYNIFHLQIEFCSRLISINFKQNCFRADFVYSTMVVPWQYHDRTILLLVCKTNVLEALETLQWTLIAMKVGKLFECYFFLNQIDLINKQLIRLKFDICFHLAVDSYNRLDKYYNTATL